MNMRKGICFVLAFMELIVAYLWWCNGDKAGMIVNLSFGISLLIVIMLTENKG